MVEHRSRPRQADGLIRVFVNVSCGNRKRLASKTEDPCIGGSIPPPATTYRTPGVCAGKGSVKHAQLAVGFAQAPGKNHGQILQQPYLDSGMRRAQPFEVGHVQFIALDCRVGEDHG